MEDAPKEGGRWAQEWSPRGIVAYLLASHSILLGCEREGHKKFGFEFGLCGFACEDTMASTDLNVLKVEGCAVRLVTCVFFWVEEEEVCNYYHGAFIL